MGTHPIFESDFDCLTDFVKRLETEKEKLKETMAKSDFDIEEFKRSMAKATTENEKLRAQNNELNQDIAQIQTLVGDFAKTQESNDSIIAQLKTLETANKTHADSIEEKNKLLSDFAERIESMKEEGFTGKVTMADLKEIRDELNETSKRNELLENQSDKMKKALEAQKKYIGGLTAAVDLSHQARDKMREEVEVVKKHRDQLQEQLVAHQNLTNATHGREIQ